MGWGYLGIFFAASLLVCLCGFKKYVYFLSLGYGFSVSAIGLCQIVMSLCGVYKPEWPMYILSVLLVVYGFRLSGFLLIRELKNAGYRKTLAAVTGDEKAMPVFVKIAMWLAVAVLYVAQTSPVSFRLLNGGKVSVLTWIGIVICIGAIALESAADQQKSAQKKVRPDMVATKGLYRIVRCPNYLGEILFWTGLVISSLDTLSGVGQWLTVLIAWVCIVYIMFNGAQRLERRQMARYADSEEYKNYADKTPIILPLIPLYHLNKQK